jgi:hypothetical protein
MSQKALVTTHAVGRSILLIRGHNVLLDMDLAALYGVGTKVLNQAVRRNPGRFPEDFMFQLTRAETKILRSQSVTSRRHGGHRGRPYAFTEQGVAMLSSVLRSPRAVAVNVAIMRAFVDTRRTLSSHADLHRRLDDLEQKYDVQFTGVFRAIRRLMAPPKVPRRRIGFGQARVLHSAGARATAPTSRRRGRPLSQYAD